jgi:hypothetical protein
MNLGRAIKRERKQAEEAALKASDSSVIKIREEMYRQLVALCDDKIEVMKNLEWIADHEEFCTALNDPAKREELKAYLSEQGLWPPKET